MFGMFVVRKGQEVLERAKHTRPVADTLLSEPCYFFHLPQEPDYALVRDFGSWRFERCSAMITTRVITVTRKWRRA